MFNQKNNGVTLGCIYHIFIFILYAPVHFVHYTSITWADEERLRERHLSGPAVSTNTKKCNYFIMLFCFIFTI